MTLEPKIWRPGFTPDDTKMNRKFRNSKNEWKMEKRSQTYSRRHPWFWLWSTKYEDLVSLMMIRKWIGDLAIQKMNVKNERKKKGVKPLPLVLILEHKIWRPGLTPGANNMNRKCGYSKNECKMKQKEGVKTLLTTTPLVLTLEHQIWRPGLTPGWSKQYE